MENPSEKNRIVVDSYGSGAKDPKLKQGVYHAVGASCDESGKINPKGGISPNVKTGYPEDGR